MVINCKQSRQQRRFVQRQEKKDLRKQENAEAEVATQIKRIFQSVLMKEQLDEIAKTTKFITRQREVSSRAIVAVLMLGCSGSQNISSLETISVHPVL